MALQVNDHPDALSIIVLRLFTIMIMTWQKKSLMRCENIALIKKYECTSFDI
jgi:hypothetical protein